MQRYKRETWRKRVWYEKAQFKGQKKHRRDTDLKGWILAVNNIIIHLNQIKKCYDQVKQASDYPLEKTI